MPLRPLATLLIAFVLAPLLRAHDPFVAEIRGESSADTLVLRLTLAPSLAAHLAGVAQKPGLAYDPARWPADHAAFDRAAPALIALSSGGRPLAPSAASAAFDAGTDIVFTLAYPRSSAVGALQLSCPWLARLPVNDSYAATVVIREGEALVAGPSLLSREEPVVAFNLASVGSASRTGWTGFLKLGVEHILTGYDHLLFLAALILGCTGLRAVAGIVTAFTVAHSLTLAVAVLGWVNPPSALVEQIIAASIVFVAVENLWLGGKPPRLRIAVAGAFGLVHGFGFAGLLAERLGGIGGAAVAVPLLSFNLGVEAGQLLVILCVLPLLLLARRLPVFVTYGQPSASVCVAVIGLYWLIARL